MGSRPAIDYGRAARPHAAPSYATRLRGGEREPKLRPAPASAHGPLAEARIDLLFEATAEARRKGFATRAPLPIGREAEAAMCGRGCGISGRERQGAGMKISRRRHQERERRGNTISGMSAALR